MLVCLVEWRSSRHWLMVRFILDLCGEKPMFVRAVWRVKRLVDIRQTLREMDVPSTKEADFLGIAGPDFKKMTRSLFDR